MDHLRGVFLLFVLSSWLQRGYYSFLYILMITNFLVIAFLFDSPHTYYSLFGSVLLLSFAVAASRLVWLLSAIIELIHLH
jgi:hypothetical protein